MVDREPPNAAGGQGPWDAVGKVGSQLAQGLRGNPPLAAICLILLIFAAAAAFVATQTGNGTLGLGSLVLLALAALGIVSVLARGRATHGSTPADGTADTDARDEKPTAAAALTTDGRARDYSAHLDALDGPRIGNIRSWLSESAAGVARVLNVSARNVRACIYVHDVIRDQVRIVPTLSHHIDADSDEMTLALPVGVGVAGRCLQEQALTIARLEQDWGKFTIPDSQFRKMDPGLRWITSLPVLPKRKTVMVLNVDGVEDSPALAQLEQAAGTLPGWATLVHQVTGADRWVSSAK